MKKKKIDAKKKEEEIKKMEEEIKKMFYTTHCVEGLKYDPDCNGRSTLAFSPILESHKK